MSFERKENAWMVALSTCLMAAALQAQPPPESCSSVVLALVPQRHFFGREAVKRCLDQMAAHKLNVFHWHLTEDQGWRLALARFPELARYGSVRPDSPAYGSRGLLDRGAAGSGGLHGEDVRAPQAAHRRTRQLRAAVPSRGEMRSAGHGTAANMLQSSH